MVRPRGWSSWLHDQVTSLMVRVSRQDQVERKLHDYASYRAIDFWEDDQTLATEEVAVQLARHPARTVGKLRSTPAGCRWLIRRWRVLARADAKDWTEEQRQLAAQLVGSEIDVDPTLAGFPAAQVAELTARLEQVAEADRTARSLVINDWNDAAVPNLGRHRRHTKQLFDRMRWCVDQLQALKAEQPAPQAGVDVLPPHSINPAASDRGASRAGETKPPANHRTHRLAQTNPIDGLSLMSGRTKLMPQPPGLVQVKALMPVQEPAAHRDRSARPDLGRIAAERTRARRRRAALLV